MKVWIYLGPEGMERVAKGEEPYYWDFSVRREGDAIPTDKVLIAEGVEVQLPSRITAVQKAIASIEAARREEQKAAMEKDREYQVRINNLLSLTYSPAEDSL